MAKEDMNGIANYIANDLQNPSAARNLLAKMLDAANRLINFPYINPAYQPLSPSEFEYRKLIMRNYIMFYRVDEGEKKIIIARVVYGRRDYEEMLRGNDNDD